jgi:3-phosphoshikimate 1-carboxyvinyltransferase
MCYAEGQSYLRNVPNARIKETDRIAVMASELSKLGVAVQELSDGLSITGRAASAPSAAVTVGRIVGGLAAVPAPVAPAPASVASFGSAGFPGSSGFSGSSGFLRLQGHGDHRVVMALAIAALGADRLGEEPAARTISIDTAESAAVTYPGFLQLLGASMVEDSTQ